MIIVKRNKKTRVRHTVSTRSIPQRKNTRAHQTITAFLYGGLPSGKHATGRTMNPPGEPS